MLADKPRHVFRADYAVDVYGFDFFGYSQNNVFIDNIVNVNHHNGCISVFSDGEFFHFQSRRFYAPSDQRHVCFDFFGKSFARAFDYGFGGRLRNGAVRKITQGDFIKFLRPVKRKHQITVCDGLSRRGFFDFLDFFAIGKFLYVIERHTCPLH